MLTWIQHAWKMTYCRGKILSRRQFVCSGKCSNSKHCASYDIYLCIQKLKVHKKTRKKLLLQLQENWALLNEFKEKEVTKNMWNKEGFNMVTKTCGNKEDFNIPRLRNQSRSVLRNERIMKNKLNKWDLEDPPTAHRAVRRKWKHAKI